MPTLQKYTYVTYGRHIDITYKFDEDIERKINRFQAVCGTMKRILGRKQERKLK